MCKHKLRMRGEKRRSVQMKLNGGTRNQHSLCLLLAAGVWLEHLRLHCPSVNSTPVMLDASGCTPRTVNVICNLGFELRILTRAVKSLHGFDSPNGGEHYTKPPICTRDLHNAVTFFSFTSAAVSDSLYDPQRTFSRKKTIGKRARMFPYFSGRCSDSRKNSHLNIHLIRFRLRKHDFLRLYTVFSFFAFL